MFVVLAARLLWAPGGAGINLSAGIPEPPPFPLVMAKTALGTTHSTLHLPAQNTVASAAQDSVSPRPPPDFSPHGNAPKFRLRRLLTQ